MNEANRYLTSDRCVVFPSLEAVTPLQKAFSVRAMDLGVFLFAVHLVMIRNLRWRSILCLEEDVFMCSLLPFPTLRGIDLNGGAEQGAAKK